MNYIIAAIVACTVLWSFLNSCEVAAQRSPVAVHGDVQ